MKYYSQYHSHELFELQESLSGLSKSNRIVSIYQPHLRPIVRGKAKAKVEFGAKIGASIVNGYLRRPSQLGRLQRIVRPRHAIGTL